MTSESAQIYPGLTEAEAAQRLKQFGTNAIPEQKRNAWLEFLKRLWGPIPWMLEITVILEFVLHRLDDAIIMIFLIIFNAILSTLQEQRASNALAILRQRLKITARVKRDGEWKTIAAEELVPEDIIHIRMGDILPADVKIIEGNLLVDQSALTGESLPVEVTLDQPSYAGGVVQKGEATAVVTATGLRTRFGKTASLVGAAKSKSNLESVILSVTRSLIILDVFLAIIVLAFTWITHQSILQILPFTLILLVASVPVALPATFTIATALGAKELTHEGVLVTNLAAIEEAAGMNILCSDKTGTITENKLSVAELTPYAGFNEQQLLHIASMASDPSTQDALDLAILERAKHQGALPDYSQRQQFIPFDPATKRSEATFLENGKTIQAAKGAPHAIVPLCKAAAPNLEEDVARLAALGYRVLAVATRIDQNW
ncbi:MAG: HAD-IC family P-type ATPase, partial [Anaerolineales bacterium]